MFVVSVAFIKCVICSDFFSLSNYSLFTYFFAIHKFVFFFLKMAPKIVQASGPTKPVSTPDYKEKFN
jgi:hypothetical protein